MQIQLFAGSAHTTLAAEVASTLGVPLSPCELGRFPDGESNVRLCESPRGRDVYILQPTSPPADQHLFELLLIADAARRAGAARITAVVPYLGYARQDRRATEYAPVAARVVADAVGAGAMDRLATVDVHTPALEGFFSIPVEPLTAVPLLAGAVQQLTDATTVLVAPDLGAAKLAERYALQLHSQPAVAMVHKVRVSGSDVRVTRVTGDVQHRAPVIVDDMITTGGTIEAAVDALLAAGCLPRITVVAAHGLFVGPAMERLGRLPIQRIVVTDSVPAPQAVGAVALALQTVSIGRLLADAIARLHQDEPLGDLIARA
jgi:ribose-phosphate pyrophosphokinase